MKKFLAVVGLLIIVMSCRRENYRTGDGKYSYLRADFAELHTTSPRVVDYLITDDGDSVAFSPRITVDWAVRGDSVYRVLAYYNLSEEGPEAVRMKQIPVMKWRKMAEGEPRFTDPLIFESAWISRNRKYLNIGFAVKTGKTDTPDTRQTLGVSCDSVKQSANNVSHIYLTLLHHQNGVPQYYSVRDHLSVPLRNVAKGSVIHLNVYTYKGKKSKILIK